MRVGLVGCGNISDIYLINAGLFKDVTITAVADLRAEAAAAQGAKYGIPVATVDDIFKRDDVDTILNLTVPAAHAEVALRALDAGKHVYGEKPLATSLADGRKIVSTAAAKGLYVGSAPDTILGAAVQTARAQLDSGEVGSVIGGTATVLGHGMEHWHPNPGFFFQPGGGPVLDMGPYYIASLVNLLGPVKSVQATGKMGFAERHVTAEGPMKGQSIKVEVLTHVNALLSFESGADVVFMASWDVWAHGQRPIELFGTKASIRVPDPNFFGGVLETATGGPDWVSRDVNQVAFGALNWPKDAPRFANYRGLGLADMGAAIREGRENRLNGAFALHVLAVMLGVLDAAGSGSAVAITDGCVRPAALGAAEATALLR